MYKQKVFWIATTVINPSHFSLLVLLKPHISDMALSYSDLGTVQEELFSIRTKYYDIGLQLKVDVGTLDCIRRDAHLVDLSDKLREMLKVWLKTAREQKWQTIVEALNTKSVSEGRLAWDIEAKYCQGIPVQASGCAMPTQTLAQQQTKDQPVEQVLKNQRQIQQQLERSSLQSQENAQRLEKQLQRAIDAGQHQQGGSGEQLQQKEQVSAQPPQHETAFKKLTWWNCPEAPEAMSRGSVAVDGTTAYLNDHGSTRVHQYHSDCQKWSPLPNLPHTHSTLVIADGRLTSVGGYLGQGQATSSLLSLSGKRLLGRKWSSHFPQMISKRCNTAAVCTGRILIIAGGDNGREYLATVEVLDMDSRKWSTVSSLPHPFSQATISICGERLYMLGGYDHKIGDAEDSIFTCSIAELLQSRLSLPKAGKLLSPSKNTIWQRITVSSNYGSSCTTLCGWLVVVGGRDEAGEDTTTISAYDETTNSWLDVDSMTVPRYRALVASLPDNMMMVVGGFGLSAVEIVKVL